VKFKEILNLIMSYIPQCCVTADLMPGTATAGVYGFVVILRASFYGHTAK
jgi:hypothetical protein